MKDIAKVERMISELTPEQREHLQSIMKVKMASHFGAATNDDIMKAINEVPKSELAPIKDIILAMND